MLSAEEIFRADVAVFRQSICNPSNQSGPVKAIMTIIMIIIVVMIITNV